MVMMRMPTVGFSSFGGFDFFNIGFFFSVPRRRGVWVWVRRRRRRRDMQDQSIGAAADQR